MAIENKRIKTVLSATPGDAPAGQLVAKSGKKVATAGTPVRTKATAAVATAAKKPMATAKTEYVQGRRPTVAGFGQVRAGRFGSVGQSARPSRPLSANALVALAKRDPQAALVEYRKAADSAYANSEMNLAGRFETREEVANANA